jgi:hypothetical protein
MCTPDFTRRGKDFCGPATWTTGYCFAVTYTPEKEKYAKMWVNEVLPNMFSCNNCRTHFKQKLSLIPVEPYLGSNDDFFFWWYLIQDMVNKERGKVSPPYEETKRAFFSALGEECLNCDVKTDG